MNVDIEKALARWIDARTARFDAEANLIYVKEDARRVYVESIHSAQRSCDLALDEECDASNVLRLAFLRSL